MATYNLPAVRSDGSLPLPAGYGAWETVPNLDALATSLAVGSERADPTQLKSIPDAWAQPQVFHQALTDPSHPLHLDIVAQWRGLLALFGLQPEFATVYDLEVTPVDLRDAGRSRLKAVLRHLLPAATAAPGLSWRTVGCVLFRERPAGGGGVFAATRPAAPIGLLSATTLVATGKDAHKLRCAALPWLVDGLTDPLSVEGLAPRHYQILAQYLEGLATALVEMNPDSFDQRRNDLVALLRDYYEACVARVEQRAPLTDAVLTANWPAPGFSMLGRTAAFDSAKLPVGTSECLLTLRAEAEAVFKGVVLVDPAMAETYGRAPEAITVWGRYSLKDAANPATLARIREDAAAAGYIVVEPADFFTRELVCFTTGTEIEWHGRQGFEAALMPFSPLVLLLLRPDVIATAADMSVVGDEFRVRLNLPLPGGKQHALRKTFGPNLGPEAAVQVDEDRLDDLAIWPNFASRSWRWNYLHFQCAPKYEVLPRFGVSAEFLAQDLLKGTIGVADRIRRLAEWDDAAGLLPDKRLFAGVTGEVHDNEGRLLLQRLRFAETENLIGEFQRLPRGVEAIFFARRQDGEGTERPVGLVLVRPKPAHPAPSEATVAIDFGTTNTVAYEKQGSTTSPIVFEDRLLFPIRHTGKEAEQRERLVAPYTQFFPLKRHETPFPTVAKRREFRVSGSAADESFWTQLKSGHDAHGFSDCIFFVPEFAKQHFTEFFLQWTREGILVFNIKWARGEESRRLTRRFLRQLMMMCAAELASRGIDPAAIQWRFSYPQAFTRHDYGDLETQIVHAWAELFERDADEGRGQIKMETEGAAAAHYFMYGRELDQSRAGKLMLMFDIGGGTTDVALWYNEELRWRNSFRLAGGDFFTRYLANNIGILDKIDFGEVANGLDDPTKGALNAEARLNYVELVVNAPSFSRNFETNFPTFSQEPAGAGLRQCASVAVGGVFYYVGMVLRELAAQGHIAEQDLKDVTLAFAGRGSALLRYFDRGPTHDTPLHHLGGLLAIAAGLEPTAVRIDTLFSKKPKHEVSLGLLQNISLGRTTESRIAPLGEGLDVAVNGGRATLGPSEDVRRLLGASDPRELQLKELSAFLAALKKQTGIEIDLQANAGEAARQIQQVTASELRRALRDLTADDVAEDTQFVEPLFITELRALVNLMNLPNGQRDRTMTVKERLR